MQYRSNDPRIAVIIPNSQLNKVVGRCLFDMGAPFGPNTALSSTSLCKIIKI